MPCEFFVMYFNPRAPYGARRKRTALTFDPLHFNPRAPYGARLAKAYPYQNDITISIHAPHTGRDGNCNNFAVASSKISIHAPHTGRDSKNA